MRKYRELIARIAAEAKRQSVQFVIEREGANHTIFCLGSTRFPVPRHSEINVYTAEAIMKRCQAASGVDGGERE